MSTATTTAQARELSAAALERAGLLRVESGVVISRFAVFVPADELGMLRPVTIRTGAVIDAFAIIHGGTTLAEQVRIEAHAVVGKPEYGYAVGRTYPGAGAATVIGAGVMVRSAAIIYADVHLGANTLVGHHTLVRSGVEVGADSLLGHHLTVERDASIGREVRCSPGSHLTSATRVADRVFLGAGIRTINDNTLTWRHPHRTPDLRPPIFETAARVGTGATLLSGVVVGERALVGAGSLVTRSIPAGALAYGCPARVHGQADHVQ